MSLPGVSPVREAALVCGSCPPSAEGCGQAGLGSSAFLLLPTREGSPELSLGEGASSLLTFQLALLYFDISDYSAQLPVVSGNASALPPSLVCGTGEAGFQEMLVGGRQEDEQKKKKFFFPEVKRKRKN